MVDLTKLNTFKVSVKAKELIEVKDLRQVKELQLLSRNFNKTLILGLGANILFTRDFQGLVIKNSLKGIKILEEDSRGVKVQVASGEDWHDFVSFCVHNGFQGVENLAYIPSTTGAAVAQNIAAYGQNIQDVIILVKGINLLTGEFFEFHNEQCEFSYRESFFKRKENSNYFITSVILELSKLNRFKLDYHERYLSLQGELSLKTPPYSLVDIFNAVISLRRKKLPNWKKIGTAGSFFKNPIVSKEKYLTLSQEIKELQWYPVEKLSYVENNALQDEWVKIPAARLLDELGWKGKRIGKVGAFEKQALTIVNYGGATGMEIYAFSKLMQKDIKSAYDIDLVPEVKII